jgi:hypothetical protein
MKTVAIFWAVTPLKPAEISEEYHFHLQGGSVSQARSCQEAGDKVKRFRYTVSDTGIPSSLSNYIRF